MDVKYKIRSLRKSEKSRKRRWLVKIAKNDFKSNPYNAGKTLLDPECYVNIEVELEDLDQHKSSSLTDINYDVPLANLEGLPDKLQKSSKTLQKSFPTNCFSFEDFFQILSTRRNAKYKICPKINKFLFKIFLSCMNKGIIPLQWRSAKEIYIPKVKPPTENKISDFRPIALLNVESKLFFSLVPRCLETHLRSNSKFTNKSVQKGCMEKVPGCWEHISMVWAALKEAKSKNLSLATIWLDIANAYGSIPHKLIIFALHRYGVSPKWIYLIETYYSGIFSKSLSQKAPSSWHRHQCGLFACCTRPITLFLAGMNIILEYSLVATTPQFHLNNISLPPMRAFMDDVNIMSSTICGAKILLSRCTIALNWAGLTFRADKSRSIVIKGRSMNTAPFSVSSPRELSDFTSFIPSIHSRPVKFLGQIIDGSISDRKSLHELEKKLLDTLNIIDTSHFTGSQKLWFLQHLLSPGIQWPILIYEVPISLAFKLEQKASVHIRKWLKLHRSITSLSLYSSALPCALPVRSLTSVLKSSKISGHC